MLAVIVILVGAALGAAWADSFGAAIGAVAAWLLLRSFQQATQIAALQAELARLQAPPVAIVSSVPEAMQQAVPVVETPAAARRGLTEAEPVVFAARAADAATLTDAASATARDDASLAPGPDLLAPVRQWLFGGNTIVKAGIAILFIGLAFLAKFATEHVALPIEFRLTGIGVVAIVLLVVGWRLRNTRAQYAQALQGGAVAVLYLLLFAAFKFYGVLSTGPAFASMVVVAALAAALAVLQDARSLAVIGAVGGFATPLIVSNGSGNHVALFGYYLVLDLGIAAVAWFRTWRSLNLIGFLFTFVIATAWGVLQYRPENFANSEMFLVAFFVLFIAILLMPARRARPAGAIRPDAWVNGSLLFGLPTVVFALQYGLVRDTAYGAAISALVLAAFYVGLATVLRKRPALALPFEGTLAVGTVFVTLVIPFALDARSTAGAWSLEGAGLVWLGWRQSRGISRAFGYVLLLLAGGSMLLGHDRFGVPTLVFNAYFFNASMACAACLAAALSVKRHAPAMSRGEEAAAAAPSIALSEWLMEPVLIGWATLWAIAGAALEFDTFVADAWTIAAWLVFFSVLVLLYTLLSVRLRWPRIALPTMAHAPILCVGVAAGAWQFASPVQGGGWWAWPVAFVAHGVVLRFAAPQWPRLASQCVHASGVLVLAALGALLGRAITTDWGTDTSAWPWLGWLVVPAILLMWLPRPAAANRWPVRAEPAAYQGAASLVLTVGLLCWTLLANVVSDGSAQPLPHVPLLNPLDIGVGVALLAAWWWMRSAASQSVFRAAPQAPGAVLGVAGFVWLNAMLVRGFHHYAGVPYRFDAWTASLAVQTGITLLWSITALVMMWLSVKRAARVPWMVGAGLLAAVVLKLLLVDLSGSGTVTRIVSFIGVGVLMLVIGYVAPLPSKAGASKASPAQKEQHAPL